MRYIIYDTKSKKIKKVINTPYMVDGEKGILPSGWVELECEGDIEGGKPDLKNKKWKRSLWSKIFGI